MSNLPPLRFFLLNSTSKVIFQHHHFCCQNFPDILKIIEEKELPVIPIESKSGGLHIYVFTKEKVPATLIREFLQNLLFLFKLPSKTEIFPKQTKLGVNQNNEKTNQYLLMAWLKRNIHIREHIGLCSCSFNFFQTLDIQRVQK